MRTYRDRELFKHVGFLIFIAGLIFLFKLGDAPLWDRDEPRNAGCAAEMMQANDWVVPIFNAKLRTHKPVLLYWLMMTSYSLFGIHEFAARFSSALLGVGTVLLTYGIGRRLFNPRVGFWAGLVLSSTIMFAVAARAATPDSLLMFCGTLALALFVRFAFDSKRDNDFGMFPSSIWQAVLIYGAMGLGVLAKGPVGLVVPTAVIGMYLLIVRLPQLNDVDAQRSNRMLSYLRPFAPMHFLRTCWAMRPLTAVLSASLIAAPWYVWVAVRTNGVWTEEFFWTHNFSRATQTMEGHAGPPILFYVGAILVGFFPWSILTIPAGMNLRANWKEEATNESRRPLIFLLCWIGVYIGIFSLAQTKLPSYVTPCYPAIAVLAAVFVCDWMKAKDFSSWTKFWLKIGNGNLVAVGCVLLVALPIAARKFLPGSEWLGLVGVIPLLGGLAVWFLNVRGSHASAARVLGGTAVVFLVFLMGVLPAEIGRHRKYTEFFQVVAKHDGPIATYGHLEPSWIFYSGKALQDFEVKERDEFLNFLRSNPNALVITTPERIENDASESDETRTTLFSDFQLVHETEYFLRERPLLVIHPQLQSHSTTNLAERHSTNLTK